MRSSLYPSLANAEKVLNPQNQPGPSDPRFSEQWALHNTGQGGGSFGSDIGAITAWRKSTGRLTTIIAIIDSGIDFTHPDLTNNEWRNSNPSADGDLNGWDYITESGAIKDEQGHGTAIAGIIAAEGDNQIGVAGVMWRASLMGLRVLDNTGTGDVANAVEAIDYAVMHGAQVINLSWGTTEESVALKQAIERATLRGVLVICSAGNSGQDIDTVPYYPASFNIKDLIAVASTDQVDQVPAWSNWGRKSVGLAAPGTNILTTQMGGGYWTVSGTSASAPFVTGVAGLIKSARPWLNAQDIAKTVEDEARKVSFLTQRVSSGGVVNAAAALEHLQGSPAPPRPPTGIGSGGRGPGGSFSTTPPPKTTGTPGGNLPNLDELRNTQPVIPKAKTPIQSNLMCADCDPLGGGGGGGYYPSGDPNFSTARMRPPNETGRAGVDLGSRNFNWSTPLVSLPGRGGLDLNLSLFLNSLVWTKDGGYIKYNADLGSPAAGFQIGFPKLQQRFTDSQTGGNAYVLVTPSGGRVEMRQVGASTTYESQDGGYTQLDASNPNAMLVRTTDGTQFTYVPVNINGEYRCTQIKDRNGNYLSATYDATNGHLQTVTDTLARLITFVYDGTGNLQAIRQTWNGVAHDWATFLYGEVWVAPAFGGGLLVNGANNNYVTVLTQVSLHDGTSYTFEYNAAFGQVNRINHYAADGHLLAYTSYNMNSSAGQTDCPRFTEQRDWAENWNNSAEAVTGYLVAGDNSWTQETMPDGTIYKEFFAISGWQTGLTTSTEFWSGGVKKKWTTTSWTQDDENLTYQKNPRVTETNVYDAEGNRRRTGISYGPYAAYSLPYQILEYAADGVTAWRSKYIDYNLSADYVNRRIIGLPMWVHLVDHIAGIYVSKTTYDYDYGGEYFVGPSPDGIQHDTTNYGTGFITGRGNLAAVWRWDVTDINNAAKAIPQVRTAYNSLGSIYFTRDGLGHQTTFSYTDAFSDNNNSRGTFAYPTTMTDADGFSSTAQYNFDFGAVTRTQGPPPAGQTQGAIQTMTYDAAARIDRVTLTNNGAYTRYVYNPYGDIDSFSTIQDGAGEAFSVTYFDGAGRLRSMASDLPGSTGGYVGQFTLYDVMGRVSQLNCTLD